MTPYAVVNTLQNPQATYGDRKSFKGVFYEPPLDPQFARVIFDDFMAKIQSDADLKSSAIILEFTDMRKICEVPLTATALASRSPTQNGIICLRWTDPSKDLEHRTWAREVQSKWKAELDARASQSTGSSVPQYINYAEREYLQPILSMKLLIFYSAGDAAVANIYGENLARLRQVKAKYDPKNVFHKMQPIPST
jgi:FAD/FMN-containing dehydrogenase